MKLRVIFDEPLDKTSAEQEANYSLDGAAPSKAILQDSAGYRVHLNFDLPFEENSTYQLSVQNIQDTLGNTSSIQQVAFTFRNEIDSVFAIAANLLAVRFSEIPTLSSAQNFNNYTLSTGAKPIAQY